jgi:biopolymer transport protein ExbD
MQFKTKHREIPTIEIAPLVDVVFLLLLFFMVTTQFTLAPGLKVSLPTINESAPVARTAKISVGLNAAGDIYVNGEITALSDLHEILKNVTPNPESAVVLLEADRNTSHGSVVAVMDEINRIGFRSMVIAARWKKE